MNSSFERSYIKTLKNVLRKLNFEEDKGEKVGTKNGNRKYLHFILSFSLS